VRIWTTAPRTTCAPLAGNTLVPAGYPSALRPSMKSLTIAGCVCGLLALVVFPIIFAPLGMILGVAALAKGRAENGVAVIILAGVCGYYGMTNSLHFMDSLTTTAIADLLRSAPAPLPTGADNFHVVSLQTRVTTSDDDPICSWRLEIKNDSAKPATFHGTISFEDDHGVAISEDHVNSYPVPPGTVGVVTGSLVVKSKTKIARAVPQIAMARASAG
jgi:hypothetical protein